MISSYFARVGGWESLPAAGGNHAHVTATTSTPPNAHNVARHVLSNRFQNLSYEEVDREDQEEGAKRPAKAYLRQP